MTLLDRPTLVDRPELVNRDKQEDREDEQGGETIQAEALGNGGGPVLHGIEFRPGDYDIVAGANLAAVLSTGNDEGDVFAQSFRNAAIQLYELKDVGEDISDIVRFSVEKGVAETGLTDPEIEVLTRQPEEELEDVESESNEDNGESEKLDDQQQRTPDEDADSDEADNEDGDAEIDDVEESLEEVKEDNPEDDG
jgi:hypothetical protein